MLILCFTLVLYSVIGLNLDYVVLNVLGHSVYGLFNLGLYWIPSVQLQYFELHPMGVIPVQTNDVVFSVHATIFSVLMAVQCIIYEVYLCDNYYFFHCEQYNIIYCEVNIMTFAIIREEPKQYHRTLGPLLPCHPPLFFAVVLRL